MNQNQPTRPEPPVNPFTPPVGPTEDPRAVERRREQREATRWWIKIVVQPVIFVACLAAVLLGIGIAQKRGWLDTNEVSVQAPMDSDQRYICPMMCTPPMDAPGRCPVCGMELVPVAQGAGNQDPHAVTIPNAARRVANIQTVSVQSIAVTRTIRAIGELNYDESARKTLAAYVDGRVEKLYADYTGVHVSKGDHLALLYSPELYTSQVSYLLAKESQQNSQSSTLGGAARSSTELLKTARRRLQEMGMSDDQIAVLDEAGEANSRVQVNAPISGTVINKLVTEGQYIEEGQAIYELADLSNVWLMLRLFPEDAAAIRYGQRVEAEVDSLPGEQFLGRVAFIDPNVEPMTRTVGVRVVIPNSGGRLRIGDYARARIDVPFSRADQVAIYDPELADKWISPRHPHIVSAEPGACPLCGVDLVPASTFGFTDQPSPGQQALVVPRDAVLMAGGSSMVYVETEPGRFEIRPVVLGPVTGDQIVLHSGVQVGDQVATRGNFLIDSQMQLSGNPSLIDPTKLHSMTPNSPDERIRTQLAKLSREDRAAVEKQMICPVTDSALGSMGEPLKIELDGETIYICCAGCEARLRAQPAVYLAKLTQPAAADPTAVLAIETALAELPADDQVLARAQEICPVANMPLGSMGMPVKVNVQERTLFLCCAACRSSLLDDPERYFALLDQRAEHGAEQAVDQGSDDSAPAVPTGRPQPIDSDAPPLPTGKPKVITPSDADAERTANAQPANQRGAQ